MAEVEVQVRDNPDEHRFEVWAGGALAGFTVYHALDGVYDYVHTEIRPDFEGQGLGSRLIRAALDETRARGLGVLPHCPFVRTFVARHADYLDLVPANQRERFTLPTG